MGMTQRSPFTLWSWSAPDLNNPGASARKAAKPKNIPMNRKLNLEKKNGALKQTIPFSKFQDIDHFPFQNPDLDHFQISDNDQFTQETQTFMLDKGREPGPIT